MTEPEPKPCPLGRKHCPVYADIEQLQLELRQLRREVIRDPLTGLFNRRHFNDLMATEMERSRRSEQPTSLVLLDLDHFKLINDQYGHVEGDRVLRQLARTLESTLRRVDIPCRYGGEEFAIILPATPLATARQVAERLRKAVASMQVAATTNGQSPLHCTASFGVSAFYHSQIADPTAIIKRADQQLYAAKRRGRNRVASETLRQSTSQLSEEEKAALAEHNPHS